MISVNIEKAKLIGHAIRRDARAQEFLPLDEVIMKQIPGTDIQAVETQRQAIREKYAAMQAGIESANSADEIKAVLKGE